jgi:molybdopterin converting factor subunit 1
VIPESKTVRPTGTAGFVGNVFSAVDQDGLEKASFGAMQITVLYFSAVRELVGQSEEVLDLPSGVRTVADLAAYVVKLHPALSGRLAAVRWARNEEFVEVSAVLAPGDTVAALPPVAGG